MGPFNMIFMGVVVSACITVVASATITICLTGSALIPSSISGLAITASVVQICAVMNLFIATTAFVWRLSDRVILIAWCCGVIFSLVGAALDLTALGKAIDIWEHESLHQTNITARTLAGAGLACIIAGLVLNILSYALMWPRGAMTVIKSADGIFEERPSTSHTTIKQQSFIVHLASMPAGSPQYTPSLSAATSKPFSAFSNSSWSSFRDAFRPQTSRTRLLLGTSLASRDSRSIHSAEPAAEALRNNDDFGNWDTSAVEGAYDTPFSFKVKATKLETIPGSRPVSPAHPLEHHLCGVPAGYTPSLELTDGFRGASDSILSPSNNLANNLTLDRTRSSSSRDQSHIHPLFRNESPVPPPLVSPGTIITASPHAGQVVSPESALNPKLAINPLENRPETPRLAFSPLTNSPTSLRSFRAALPALNVDVSDSIMRQVSPSEMSSPND